MCLLPRQSTCNFFEKQKQLHPQKQIRELKNYLIQAGAAGMTVLMQSATLLIHYLKHWQK